MSHGVTRGAYDDMNDMTLIEAENAIIEEFSMYEEWLDKYE